MDNLRFRPTYLFSIDYRCLAIFRALLGFLCIIDIFRRWPYVELLYANSGIFSNHFALYSAKEPLFSLLFSLNDPWEVKGFFIVTIISAFYFMVGSYTRISTLTTLLLMVSIINRNLMTIYGGDTVIINLLFVSLLLPLGATWSVDAKRKGVSAVGSYQSLAVSLLYLQIVVIYFFAAVHKTGVTWNSGLGLYYSLYQDRVVTAFGEALRNYAPMAILKLGSYFSLYVEFIGALLVLSPFRAVACRRIAFYVLTLFHIGIVFCLNLGLFEYLMITLLTTLLSSRELDWIEHKVIRRWITYETIPYSTTTRSFLMNSALSCLLAFIFFSHLIGGNTAFRSIGHPQLPKSVNWFVNYTSYRQTWAMFAPDAPTHDSYLIFDATLADGSKVDLITGQPFVIKPLERLDRYWDQQLDSVIRLFFPGRGIPPVELTRWIEHRRGGIAIPSNAEILSLVIHEVIDRSPTPGERHIASSFDLQVNEKFAWKRTSN